MKRKVKLTPRQVQVIIDNGGLKHHPMTMTGKSAKVFHKWKKGKED